MPRRPQRPTRRQNPHGNAENRENKRREGGRAGKQGGRQQGQPRLRLQQRQERATWDRVPVSLLRERAWLPWCTCRPAGDVTWLRHMHSASATCSIDTKAVISSPMDLAAASTATA
jgi:hypothetical protein